MQNCGYLPELLAGDMSGFTVRHLCIYTFYRVVKCITNKQVGIRVYTVRPVPVLLK